jgi:hypothetical protein
MGLVLLHHFIRRNGICAFYIKSLLKMLATDSDLKNKTKQSVGQTKHICRLDGARGHQFTVSGLELFSGF